MNHVTILVLGTNATHREYNKREKEKEKNLVKVSAYISWLQRQTQELPTPLKRQSRLFPGNLEL